MTQLFTAGEGLSRHQLVSLELDGLLTPLTQKCWVASGEPITPTVRSNALTTPPVKHVAFSHETAYWVWWGDGMSPETTSVSATKRKRVRSIHDGFHIHETLVPHGHTVKLGKNYVTSEAATLYALLFDLCEDRIPQETSVAQARDLLLRIPAEARVAFATFLRGLYRRPRLTRLRKLAHRADPLIAHLG